MQLNGYIRVPVSKIGRALKFAEKYQNVYDQRLKDSYQQALDNIAIPLVGKRSLSRAFGLVPTSFEEAYKIAREELVTNGCISWFSVAEKTANVKVNDYVIHRIMLEQAVPELKAVFIAGHSLDYILLSIDSCKLIDKIIDLANAEQY